MKLERILNRNIEAIEGLVDELEKQLIIRRADELKITGDMKSMTAMIKLHKRTLKLLGKKKVVSDDDE